MLQGRVLIVDVDAAARAALAEAAGRLGFEPLLAATGAQGLELAREQAPRFAVGPADEPGFGDGGVLEALPEGAVLLVVDTPGFPALPLPGLLRIAATGSPEQRVGRVAASLAALSAGLLPEAGSDVLRGDLAEVALPELLGALAAVRFTGAVVCGDDGLTLSEGQLHAARVGDQRGLPAAQALLARGSGDCRLVFADPGATDEGLPPTVEALLAVPVATPQTQVVVVTDSTSDLAPELARSHGIHVVPLCVHFGEAVLKDGIDVTPASFYPMLRERREHPHTSPPPKADFRNVFQALPAGCAVISVHISGKLSQTVLNARVATDLVRAAESGEARRTFEVVDTLQVSAGLGFLALCAARLAHRDVPPAEIRRRLQRMRSRVHLLFVVDTLEFLARGGRIGKARALLGGLLGIKPILGVVGGEVTPIDRVRGGKAAHPRLIELIRERVKPGRPLFAGVAHAGAPEWADRLAKLLGESFTLLETLRGEIGPVVGTHAGPGTVGCYVYQPEDHEEARLLAPL
jgi:DegV family protein with EDD domain